MISWFNGWAKGIVLAVVIVTILEMILPDTKNKKYIKELELWIKQYVNESGAKGIVIGNSGGKDSAAVIALATKAIRK